MRIITTREFRENQKKYFDLAEIEKIIVNRGNNRRSVLLIPLEEDEEDEIYFSDPVVIKKLKEALKEIEEGKTRRVTLKEVKQILKL